MKKNNVNLKITGYAILDLITAKIVAYENSLDKLKKVFDEKIEFTDAFKNKDNNILVYEVVKLQNGKLKLGNYLSVNWKKPRNYSPEYLKENRWKGDLYNKNGILISPIMDIIDKVIKTGEWFIISDFFNLKGKRYNSRNEALNAYMNEYKGK